MSISRNEIFNACRPILESAHRHLSGKRGFLTAYQIWYILQEKNVDFCNYLLSESGEAVGAGGGVSDGPAKRIADALAHSLDMIETYYFDPRKVFFGNKTDSTVKASGQVCNLFRLREK